MFKIVESFGPQRDRFCRNLSEGRDLYKARATPASGTPGIRRQSVVLAMFPPPLIHFAGFLGGLSADPAGQIPSG